MLYIITMTIIGAWIFYGYKLEKKVRNIIAMLADIVAVVSFIVVRPTLVVIIILIFELLTLTMIWLVRSNRYRGMNVKIGWKEIKESDLTNLFFLLGVGATFLLLM